MHNLKSENILLLNKYQCFYQIYCKTNYIKGEEMKNVMTLLFIGLLGVAATSCAPFYGYGDGFDDGFYGGGFNFFDGGGWGHHGHHGGHHGGHH